MFCKKIILSALIPTTFLLTGCLSAVEENNKSPIVAIDPWQGADVQVESAAPTDTVKPQIQITNPTDDAKLIDNSVLVQLAANDDSGWVEVVVQNLDAAGQARETYAMKKDGSVPNFKLHAGWNTILALARDKAGNVSTHFILVEQAEKTSELAPTPRTDSESTSAPAPIPEPEPVAEPRGRYRDGTYTGTGYYGWGENKFPLTVQITVEQGYLRRLDYLEFPTSDLVTGETFLDPMKNQLLQNQEIEKVNTISGATGTSNAFLTAVNAALASAK